MKKGLTTLGVSAAALLSGSVFALGPTIDSIPTVIVTDRTTLATDFDGLAVTSGPTSNLFRFTDALDLATYLHDADTPTTGLKYLFSERDTPGSSTESSPSTIAIDGLTGSPYATVKATVDASGIAVSTAPGAALDFRNVRVSPGTGTGPYAAPTGLPESRTLRLYVSDQTVGTTMATQDFTVITTNASGSYDSVSAVGSPTVFTGPETPIDNFDNWTSTQITTFALIGSPGSPYPATLEPLSDTAVNPQGAVVVSGTTFMIRTLALGSPVPSLGVTIGGSGSTGLGVFWSSGPTQGVAVTADTLYRVRYTLSGTNASLSTLSGFRFRTGDPTKIGDIEDTFTNPVASGGPSTAGTFSYNSWISPKTSGSMQFAFDAYDLTSTQNIGAALESVSINATTRAAIAGTVGATVAVVQNVGNPSLSPFSGEPAPDASAVSNFPTPTTNGDLASIVGTQRPITTTLSPTAVTFTVSARSAPNTDENFTLFNYGDITAGNGFFSSAPGNTLFVSDLWVTAPGGASDAVALFRFGIGTAVGTGGYGSLANYAGQATTNGNGGTASAIALQSSPRRYTHVFQPQVGTAADFRFETNVIATDNTAGSPRPVGYVGAVRFDRLTVTKYSNLPNLN